MTTTIQTTDLIGAGNQFTYAANDDSYYVLDGVTVASTNNIAIAGPHNDLILVVNGTVIGVQGAIIFGSDDSAIIIGENGFVTSSNNAAGFYLGVVHSAGNQITVVNNGEIYAPFANPVRSHSEDIYFENNGTMFGGNGGAIFDGSTTTDTRIINTGSISGGINYFLAHAVFVKSGVTNLLNTGHFSASSTKGSGVVLGDGNVSSDGSSIINHGEISSLEEYGVDFSQMDDAESATLINTGTISGGRAAFNGNASGETVINSGTFIGDALLKGGDDIYNGRGGIVHGQVSGGAGADTLKGGIYSDDLAGNNGGDTLLGRAGSDLLDGGSGGDTLKGGSGDDELIGGSGGDDLHGGRDDDMLTGGDGNDTFYFRRNAGDDVITDFENGSDLIDLSAYGLRPADFATVVAPALSNAGGGDTFLDLDAIGGSGSVLIEGLAFADADAMDFVL